MMEGALKKSMDHQTSHASRQSFQMMGDKQLNIAFKQVEDDPKL
jgi:hypothetical protein